MQILKKAVALLLSVLVAVPTTLTVFAESASTTANADYVISTSRDAVQSSTVQIADKTASGKSITENVLYQKTATADAQQGGVAMTASKGNLSRITDGYFNNTATESCDIGGFRFIEYDKDTDIYTYYNGYNPETMEYDANNVDTYLTLTFPLDGNYELDEFWIYSDTNNKSKEQNLTTGIWEIYVSENAEDLYDSSNKILTYTNHDLSWEQKVKFNKTYTGQYFGVKILATVCVCSNHNWQWSYARLPEVALFGNKIATPVPDYEISTSTTQQNSETQIADKTASGKSITENVLYHKKALTDAKQGGQKMYAGTSHLTRVTDGYFNNTGKENCDISGFRFIEYNKDTGVYTYYNGYDPETMEYDADNVDTYLSLTFSLKGRYDLDEFWIYSDTNCKSKEQTLTTGIWEIYVSENIDDLYDGSNKILTYTNHDLSWVQKVKFNKTYTGQYFGIKILEGVCVCNNGNYLYSYVRLPEVALFADKSESQDGTYSNVDPAKEVAFTDVTVTDDFWAARQEQSLEVSLEDGAEALIESGAIANFENTKKVLASPNYEDWDKYQQHSNFASDSDVYKYIEGMAYAIQNYENSNDEGHKAAVAKAKEYIADWVPKIADSQCDDGYIDTLFFLKNNTGGGLKPENRFLQTSAGWHELYCAGHLYEAAIALNNATGNTQLLEVAMKNFNLVYNAFYLGDTTHYTAGYKVDGHEEIELALIKLAAQMIKMNYEDKGQEYATKCIELSQFFLDNNNKIASDPQTDKKQNVDQLTEAWGHCVRAFYLYTAMADMSIYKGDELYFNLKMLWDNVETKTYITGGIGDRRYTEGFAESWDLDDENSYCETCSSISNVFWNKSMNLLYGDAKYYDNIEKQLYNNVISGLGLDGQHYFYQNWLVHNDTNRFRPEWYGTPCCPTNLIRLIQKLGSYIYTTNGENITVNMYIGNESNIALGDNNIGINMTSSMPWEGKANITLNLDSDTEFTLKLRIPNWATGNNVIKVNGTAVSATPLSDGYVAIKRTWKNNDTVSIEFPMETKVVDESEKISANTGKVAVTRGPIVYAMEKIDNPDTYDNACINGNTTFTTEMVDDFVTMTTATDYGVQKLQLIHAKSQTYDEAMLEEEGTVELTLIPFYAWTNRKTENGQGTPLKVHISSGANDPLAGLDINTSATPSASITGQNDSLSHINDGIADHTKRNRWTSWTTSNPTDANKKPDVTLNFRGSAVLTATKIYFYDDNGGCRTPETVVFEYWNGSEWVVAPLAENVQPVTNGYTNYTFASPVTTDKLRVKLTHSTASLGICEWNVTGEWNSQWCKVNVTDITDKVIKTLNVKQNTALTENQIAKLSAAITENADTVYGYEVATENGEYLFSDDIRGIVSANKTIKLSYKRKSQTYTVTLKDTDGTTIATKQELFDKAIDFAKYSTKTKWTVNGVTVDVTNNSIYVYGDMTLTVAADDATVTSAGVLDKVITENKAILFAHTDVANTDTVAKTGIIVVSKNTAAQLDSKNMDWYDFATESNTSLYAKIASFDGVANNFMVTYNGIKGLDYVAKVFVLYENGNVVYSNNFKFNK